MRITLSCVLVAACSGDVLDLPPPGEYTQWKRIDTWGTTPGHGDSYRIIYANEPATQLDLGLSPLAFPDGTILVKEVYDNASNTPGRLRVIELARRIGPASGQQAGWVFSATSTPNGDETEQTFCWRRCHVAAPLAGAWFDYSK